jgi:hypothetical protein
MTRVIETGDAGAGIRKLQREDTVPTSHVQYPTSQRNMLPYELNLGVCICANYGCIGSR